MKKIEYICDCCNKECKSINTILLLRNVLINAEGGKRNSIKLRYCTLVKNIETDLCDSCLLKLADMFKDYILE